MPAVHLPDGRVVHFPDDMPPDQITAAVQSIAGPPAKTTYADEPTDYASGFLKSAADTGMRTLKGVVRGAEASINPVNLVRGPYELGKDILTNRAQGITDTLRAIGEGNPDVGGEAIGSLLTGAAAGRILPNVSGAARHLLTPAAKSLPISTATKGPMIPQGVRDFAIDTALDAIPMGRTARTLGRAAVSAYRGATTAADEAPIVEAAAPSIQRASGPTIPGFDRYMPNTSTAPSAVEAPLPMNGPKIRALSAGEENGINELDRLMEALHGQGPDTPSIGNGTYREPALTGEVVNPDLEQGRELGRLLQKLSSGRGGSPAIAGPRHLLSAEAVPASAEMPPTQTAITDSRRLLSENVPSSADNDLQHMKDITADSDVLHAKHLKIDQELNDSLQAWRARVLQPQPQRGDDLISLLQKLARSRDSGR